VKNNLIYFQFLLIIGQNNLAKKNCDFVDSNMFQTRLLHHYFIKKKKKIMPNSFYRYNDINI